MARHILESLDQATGPRELRAMPGPLRRLARRLLGWVISDEPPEWFWEAHGTTPPTLS